MGKKKERRSSILKVTRDPLGDIDTNRPEETKTLTKDITYASRRVSFAETYQVKEFPRDSPQRWSTDNDTGPLSSDADISKENVSCEISGLDKLLTGPIQAQQSSEGPTDEAEGVFQAFNQTINQTQDMETTGCYGDISVCAENTSLYSGESHKDGVSDYFPVSQNIQDQSLNTTSTKQIFMPDKKYSQEKNFDGVYSLASNEDLHTVVNTAINKFSCYGAATYTTTIPTCTAVSTLNTAVSSIVTLNSSVTSGRFPRSTGSASPPVIGMSVRSDTLPFDTVAFLKRLQGNSQNPRPGMDRDSESKFQETIHFSPDDSLADMEATCANIGDSILVHSTLVTPEKVDAIRIHSEIAAITDIYHDDGASSKDNQNETSAVHREDNAVMLNLRVKHGQEFVADGQDSMDLTACLDVSAPGGVININHSVTSANVSDIEHTPACMAQNSIINVANKSNQNESIRPIVDVEQSQNDHTLGFHVAQTDEAVNQRDCTEYCNPEDQTAGLDFTSCIGGIHFTLESEKKNDEKNLHEILQNQVSMTQPEDEPREAVAIQTMPNSTVSDTAAFLKCLQDNSQNSFPIVDRGCEIRASTAGKYQETIHFSPDDSSADMESTCADIGDSIVDHSVLFNPEKVAVIESHGTASTTDMHFVIPKNKAIESTATVNDPDVISVSKKNGHEVTTDILKANEGENLDLTTCLDVSAPAACLDVSAPAACLDVSAPAACLDVSAPTACLDVSAPTACLDMSIPVACLDVSAPAACLDVSAPTACLDVSTAAVCLNVSSLAVCLDVSAPAVCLDVTFPDSMAVNHNATTAIIHDRDFASSDKAQYVDNAEVKSSMQFSSIFEYNRHISFKGEDVSSCVSVPDNVTSTDERSLSMLVATAAGKSMNIAARESKMLEEAQSTTYGIDVIVKVDSDKERPGTIEKGDSSKGDRTRIFDTKDLTSRMDFTSCIGRIEEQHQEPDVVSALNGRLLSDDRYTTVGMDFTSCVGRLEDPSEVSGNDTSVRNEVISEHMHNSHGDKKENEEVAGKKCEETFGMEFTTCVGGIQERDKSLLISSTTAAGLDTDKTSHLKSCMELTAGYSNPIQEQVTMDTTKHGVDCTKYLSTCDQTGALEFTSCVGGNQFIQESEIENLNQNLPAVKLQRKDITQQECEPESITAQTMPEDSVAHSGKFIADESRVAPEMPRKLPRIVSSRKSVCIAPSVQMSGRQAPRSNLQHLCSLISSHQARGKKGANTQNTAELMKSLRSTEGFSLSSGAKTPNPEGFSLSTGTKTPNPEGFSVSSGAKTPNPVAILPLMDPKSATIPLSVEPKSAPIQLSLEQKPAPIPLSVEPKPESISHLVEPKPALIQHSLAKEENDQKRKLPTIDNDEDLDVVSTKIRKQSPDDNTSAFIRKEFGEDVTGTRNELERTSRKRVITDNNVSLVHVSSVESPLKIVSDSDRTICDITAVVTESDAAINEPNDEQVPEVGTTFVSTSINTMTMETGPTHDAQSCKRPRLDDLLAEDLQIVNVLEKTVSIRPDKSIYSDVIGRLDVTDITGSISSVTINHEQKDIEQRYFSEFSSFSRPSGCLRFQTKTNTSLIRDVKPNNTSLIHDARPDNTSLSHDARANNTSLHHDAKPRDQKMSEPSVDMATDSINERTLESSDNKMAESGKHGQGDMYQDLVVDLHEPHQVWNAENSDRDQSKGADNSMQKHLTDAKRLDIEAEQFPDSVLIEDEMSHGPNEKRVTMAMAQSAMSFNKSRMLPCWSTLAPSTQGFGEICDMMGICSTLLDATFSRRSSIAFIQPTPIETLKEVLELEFIQRPLCDNISELYEKRLLESDRLTSEIKDQEQQLVQHPLEIFNSVTTLSDEELLSMKNKVKSCCSTCRKEAMGYLKESRLQYVKMSRGDIQVKTMDLKRHKATLVTAVEDMQDDIEKLQEAEDSLDSEIERFKSRQMLFDNENLDTGSATTEGNADKHANNLVLSVGPHQNTECNVDITDQEHSAPSTLSQTLSAPSSGHVDKAAMISSTLSQTLPAPSSGHSDRRQAANATSNIEDDTPMDHQSSYLNPPQLPSDKELKGEAIQLEVPCPPTKNTLADLQNTIEVWIKSKNWALKSVKEDTVTFTFLYDLIQIDVIFGCDACEAYRGNTKFTAMQKNSYLTDDIPNWSKLAHAMMWPSIDLKLLLSKYSHFNDMQKMLEELSVLAAATRRLGREVHLASLMNITDIKDTSVTFQVINVHRLIRIKVTLTFNPGAYPDQRPEMSIDGILGDASEAAIISSLEHVNPGGRYLTNLIKSVKIACSNDAV